MCVCVRARNVCRDLKRPGEGVGSAGVGVTWGCELHGVSTGHCPGRAGGALDHGAYPAAHVGVIDLVVWRESV